MCSATRASLMQRAFDGSSSCRILSIHVAGLRNMTDGLVRKFNTFGLRFHCAPGTVIGVAIRRSLLSGGFTAVDTHE